ncbi:MAG: peptidylprolyl isomerase [Deltaproteobacteria bacterium]|nr:peptidylprolyl isomerase [Deltaproteobacteria bacterium]
MKRARVARNLSLFLLGCGLLLSTAAAQTKNSTIKEGAQVSIEYTLLDEKGKKLESNKGNEPFKYTHGKGDIIPGLENGLKGMKTGEEKTIKVKPEDGYGKVNPDAFQEVPRKNIPSDLLKVGNQLVARDPMGRSMPVRIHEIKEKTVVLDLNHPLAGKTLTFEVKILSVQAVQ